MGFLLYAGILSLFGTIYIAETYSPNDSETLQSDLFASYSKKHRPNDTTNILLEFGLMHMTELDIVTQRLYCVGFLSVDWIDDRLQWTPSSYGDMKHTVALLSDVWSPILLLSNAADEMKLINDNSNFESSVVYIDYNGYVVWLAPANFIAQCTIDIRYYPFDSQSCKIMVSSWMYLEAQINIKAMFSKVNLDIYEEHGEWEIIQTSVENVTRTLNGFGLGAVKFTLHLKRKYSYYLLNMLLPVVVLAAMAPFVFMLPVESGEKIGFSLTILLSLSVVMTIVSDNIPPTSTRICVLSVYLLLTFIMCSLETLVTVITCWIHDLHNKTYVMGKFGQKVARVLARITRYRRRPPIDDVTEIKNDQSPKILEVEMKEKTGLPKQLGRNNNVWEENINEDKHLEDKVEIEYTYEDMVILNERFNFFLFAGLTSLETIIFMVVLQTNAWK